MTEEDELEKIKERHKSEIASLKRTIDKFIFLRSWLITTSLACLAFVLGFLLQIRLQGELDNLVLAQISVGFLMIAVLCAFYTKFCYEASGMLADVKDFATLFPVFLELVSKDEKSTDEEKTRAAELLEPQIDKIKRMGSTELKFNPYAEIIRFSVTGLALAIGVGASCMYFWRYLF